MSCFCQGKVVSFCNRSFLLQADRLAWPNASKANVPVTAPPKAGQPYQPQQKPVVGPPPMAGQPHQPQQNSISGPPLMPGQPQPKVVGPPPMTGQAYQPQTISGPPSMPLMPGQPQPKVVGPPPMAGQAYQPQQGLFVFMFRITTPKLN